MLWWHLLAPFAIDQSQEIAVVPQGAPETPRAFCARRRAGGRTGAANASLGAAPKPRSAPSAAASRDAAGDSWPYGYDEEDQVDDL